MLVDSFGAEVGEAPPSIAVQMSGLGAVPTAGDEFEVRLKKPPANVVTPSIAAYTRLRRMRSPGKARMPPLTRFRFETPEMLGRFKPFGGLGIEPSTDASTWWIPEIESLSPQNLVGVEQRGRGAAGGRARGAAAAPGAPVSQRGRRLHDHV